MLLLFSSSKSYFFLFSLCFFEMKYALKFYEKTHLSYDLISDNHNKVNRNALIWVTSYNIKISTTWLNL